MNVDLNLKFGNKYCIYTEYKIENINNRKYIIPATKSSKKIIDIESVLDKALIELMNIGMLAYFSAEISDKQILNYVSKYGMLGFISDYPVNKNWIIEDNIFIRDYNYINPEAPIRNIKIEDYIKIFMPRQNESSIKNTIEKCREANNDVSEKLIYSKSYAEPVQLIIAYAMNLYKKLYLIKVNNKENKTLDNYNLNICDTLGNVLNVQIDYLKQGINLYFNMLLSQETRLLKLCKYCLKAFIAKNPKAGYDTANCKNKANVYTSRGKQVVYDEYDPSVNLPITKVPDEIVLELITSNS